MNKNYVLKFSCPDKSGIQSKVTGLLYKHGAFLTDVKCYSGTESNTFFSRIVYRFDDLNNTNIFLKDFDSLATTLKMKWSINEEGKKIKTILAVSKTGHCLNDLLYRAKYRGMPIDIVGVISNHEDFREIVEFNGINFHYLPINKSNKINQEAEFKHIVSKSSAELIVLARYMQILSEELADEWFGRCINIHHSFLPSFKGSKPYHQAFDRGVKIIGATAHYVTSDLDEGPIIQQNVQRVNHFDNPETLTRKGNDIESNVLAQAVRWHAEDRIILNGSKTVIFE